MISTTSLREQFDDDALDTADGNITSSKTDNSLYKRRRITRACDPCRLRKIKCTGDQPCNHCNTYSYECSYDQPSQRRRNPSAYVEALEARVDKVEKLLRIIAPSLDLNNPAIDIALQNGNLLKLLQQGSASEILTPPIAADSVQTPQSPTKASGVSENDAALESMIRAVGQIELDEHGNWDFHGHSSGLSFVRQMRAELGTIMGPDTQSTPYIKAFPTTRVVESPNKLPSAASTPGGRQAAAPAADLPSHVIAKELCDAALTAHSVVLKVVHTPSFWKSFDSVYAVSSENWNADDRKFIPVLHSVLAVGVLYTSRGGNANYEETIEKGMVYFKAARQGMDIADVRDLPSVQAVIFMIFFLQSSSRLAQTYPYIGIAIRAAIRLGLHRSLPNNGFNMIELEMRRRIWWTIKSLDVYIGALIGLPQGLNEDDTDQELPSEAEDADITETLINHPSPGTITSMTAFCIHAQLLKTLTKIVKKVYPLSTDVNTRSYTILFSTIQEIELDLVEWKASLPSQFDPANENLKFARPQQALRVAYAFCQLLLYRPSLHFVAAERRHKPNDQRGLACAKSYIGVCRNLINLCDAVHKRGKILGQTWFLLVLGFFAILSLVYFAAENPDNATTVELMKDALRGKKIIDDLKHQSLTANRTASTLKLIFARLPEWMRDGLPNPDSKNRRSTVEEDQTGEFPSMPIAGEKIIATNETNVSGIALTTSENVLQSAIKVETNLLDCESSSRCSPYEQHPAPSPDFVYDSLQPNQTDMSSMMFSDSRPFTYPTQPIAWPNTNVERDMIAQSSQTLTNTLHGDKLEAQLYTVPSFMGPQAGYFGSLWSQNFNHDSMQTGNNPQEYRATIQQMQYQENQEQLRLQQQQQQQQQNHLQHAHNYRQSHQTQQGEQFSPISHDQHGIPIQNSARLDWMDSQHSQSMRELNLHDIFGASEWVAPFGNQHDTQL